MYTMLFANVRCFDGIHVFQQGATFRICAMTEFMSVGVALARELCSSLSGGDGGLARTLVVSMHCASIRMIVGKIVRVRCLLV